MKNFKEQNLTEMRDGKSDKVIRISTGLIAILLFINFIFQITFTGCSTESKTENSGTKPEENLSEKMSPEMLVDKISKYKNDVDNNTSKYSKKDLMLEGKGVKEGIKAVWEKMEGFFDLNKVVKIKLFPRPQYSQRQRDFYFQNGKLVFAMDKNERQKLTEGMKENLGDAFYFMDKRLISYKLYNGTDMKLTDIEQKLHELQITYEAYEFMDLLLNN
jgi:hypothetical protein